MGDDMMGYRSSKTTEDSCLHVFNRRESLGIRLYALADIVALAGISWATLTHRELLIDMHSDLGHAFGAMCLIIIVLLVIGWWRNSHTLLKAAFLWSAGAWLAMLIAVIHVYGWSTGPAFVTIGWAISAISAWQIEGALERAPHGKRQ